MKEIDKIVKMIKKFNKFLLTSHINLEGDALGSQLAMANLLICLGKHVVLLDHDKVPELYQFLPGTDLVQNRLDEKNKKFDAVIVLDCPNLQRVGRVRDTIRNAYVLNIDHHVSNEKFGDLNWVEKDASSVGEMVYKLYKKLNCKITREAALYLYIAILTDTGSFNYSNTTSTTHSIVSELLEYGIEPQDISKRIYENKTLEEIKLLGRVLNALKVVEDGRIAYIVARKRFLNKAKAAPESCENFINFARSVKEVDVAVFFREDSKKANVFNISFRSTKYVDVNKIASFFGGGGHKNASGCLLKGTFAEVKKKVLTRVRDEL